MAPMTLIEKVLFLQNVEVLADLSPEQLGRIAAITREVDVPPGKTLFRQGERSTSMYVVAQGRVAIEADGERLLEKGENEDLGAWSLLDDQPMIASATVVESAHLLRIDREDFYDVLADHSGIMQSLFRALMRRMRSLTQK